MFEWLCLLSKTRAEDGNTEMTYLTYDRNKNLLTQVVDDETKIITYDAFKLCFFMSYLARLWHDFRDKIIYWYTYTSSTVLL